MFSLYEKNYKALMVIPIALFVVFLILIFVFPKVTEGIDLVGGTVIRISLDKEFQTGGLKEELTKTFNLTDVQVNTTTGPLGSKLLIQFSANNDLKQAEQLLAQAKEQKESNSSNAVALALQSAQAVSKYYYDAPPQNLTSAGAILFAQEALNKAKQNFSKQFDDFLVQKIGLGENPKISKDQIGATLGQIFYSSGLTVLLASIVLLIIVIFILFREFIPSVAVIGAAVFDIVCAVALMAVFQIPLTLSTIPALLMMVGFSVDTDILLTNRVLKRKDHTPRHNASDSMITGMTMTLTNMGAMAVMFAVSYFLQIEVLFQISAILLFGFIGDIIATWLMNAPILIWYMEKKHGASS